MNEKDREDILAEARKNTKDEISDQFKSIKWMLGIIVTILLGSGSINIRNSIQIENLKGDNELLRKDIKLLNYTYKKYQTVTSLVIKTFDLQVKALTNKDNIRDRDINDQMSELRTEIMNLGFDQEPVRGINVRQSQNENN